MKEYVIKERYIYFFLVTLCNIVYVPMILCSVLLKNDVIVIVLGMALFPLIAFGYEILKSFKWGRLVWLEKIRCEICLFFLKRRYRYKKKISASGYKKRSMRIFYIIERRYDYRRCRHYEPCLYFLDFIVLDEETMRLGLLNDYGVWPYFLDNNDWTELDVGSLRNMALSFFDDTIEKIEESYETKPEITELDYYYLKKRYELRRQLILEATSMQEIKRIASGCL